MEPHDVDAILRALAATMAHQRSINEDLREFNRQQVEINKDVRTTLARLEALLARMITQGDNGREA